MKIHIIFSVFILVALNSFGTELESDSAQVSIESSSWSSANAPDLAFFPTTINQDYNAVVSQISSFGGLSREEFKMPVQLSFGLEKRINRGEGKRFSVGVAAGLLIVKSTFSYQDYNLTTHEKIKRSYLTVPLYVKYDYLQDRRVKLFATAGFSSEFGLSAKIERESSSYGVLESSITDRETLSSSQFNVNIGSGVNVKLAPHISVFTEASLAHYVSESRTTIWSDKALWLNIRTGINVQF